MSRNSVCAEMSSSIGILGKIQYLEISGDIGSYLVT